LGIAVGMVAASWVARVKLHGYDNALLPAYAAISITSAVGMGRALGLTEKMQGTTRPAMTCFILLVCGIQFASLIYNPVKLPSIYSDQKAGEEFLTRLSGLPGDVFIPSQPYLAVIAGKKAYALSICGVPRFCVRDHKSDFG